MIIFYIFCILLLFDAFPAACKQSRQRFAQRRALQARQAEKQAAAAEKQAAAIEKELAKLEKQEMQERKQKAKQEAAKTEYYRLMNLRRKHYLYMQEIENKLNGNLSEKQELQYKKQLLAMQKQLYTIDSKMYKARQGMQGP